MLPLAERDYFSDHSILTDPYAYFEAVREQGPVYRNPESGIVFVTGFDEILDVLRNTDDFSSVIAPSGPAAKLPFTPEGSDITPQIEAHRSDFFGGDLLVAYDDKPHSFSRALLGRLFVPSRLRASEHFIAGYSDELVMAAVASGGCELVRGIATPFVTMVIADLLGVPGEDRQLFMEAIEAGPPPGSLNDEDVIAQNQPLVIMASYFSRYVADRRAHPRDDILSELSNATYPDGSMPDALEIVRLTTFLFGAGQDTSAKLLGNAMRFIVDQPGLQDRLRADIALIPAFIEEVLRLEGSSKMTARIARRDTRIGDMAIPAGTRVMVALAAANRDPRRWTDPQAFLLDRPKIKEHLSFGRGAHACIGAPLARAEVRVILEKLFEHTAHIDLDEARHGRRGERTLEYEPSFIIRGLGEMHLELTPAPGFVPPASPSAEEEATASGLRSLLGLGRTSTAEEQARPFTTANTRIGALIADPAATAILDRHVPGVSADPRIGMGKAMTLRSVQTFAPELFTDAALDAIDAEFARLPGK